MASTKVAPAFDEICDCGVCPICLELADYDKDDCDCGECESCRENARWDTAFARVAPEPDRVACRSGISSSLAGFALEPVA